MIEFVNKFILLIVVFPLFFTVAQTYPATNGEWTLDPSRSDDFSNGFNTQKWEKGLWFNCKHETRFKNENVFVEDGKLKIRAKKEIYVDHPCGYYEVFPYTTGSLHSKFHLGNNTFVEVRAKTLNANSDMTSAIWFNKQGFYERNPNLEIDLMETLEAIEHPNMFSSTIHLWILDENGNLIPSINPLHDHPLDWEALYTDDVLSNDYHYWGLERNGRFVRFYFDGELYWEINIDDDSEFPIEYRSYIVQEELPLNISLEGHDGDHSIDNFPQDFEIDYVRVYTKNRNCPSNLSLNQIIVGDDYQANQLIQASGSINPNMIVNFKANQIVLKPGFRATGNSTGKFRAFVEPCRSKVISEDIKMKDEETIITEDYITLSPVLSPNPTSNILIVVNIKNIKEWTISDVYNKVVKVGKNNNNSDKIEINVEQLSSGVYYFNAIMKDGKLFQKTIMKK